MQMCLRVGRILCSGLAITTGGFLTSVPPTYAAQSQAPAHPPQSSARQASQDIPVVDADGTVHLPDVPVPYSDLASEEAGQAFLKYVREGDEYQRAYELFKKSAGREPSVVEGRQISDSVRFKPLLKRLRNVFAVEITAELIGGVQTDIVLPAEGVSPVNEHRVLINLHGGGFVGGARYLGQVESVPIASLGAIKVIALDYRLYPEHRFPAASEDVANVYRELLNSYEPEAIGIYGCSAGGILAAQAVAWFQSHGLPPPGAIGMFGGAGLVDRWGDSNYVSSALRGWPMPIVKPNTMPLKYFSEANLSDPLVSPAHHPDVLKDFPPSLLLSGTRDQILSSVLYMHAQLVKASVKADLHVWEGAPHCSFAGHADPDVPETREAWDVTVRFFDTHLGKSSD